MKKLIVSGKLEKDFYTYTDLIDTIHECARANGSTYKVELALTNYKVHSEQDTHSKNCYYLNSEYTIGYYAVLYLVDKYTMDKGEVASVFTLPSKDRWFNIHCEFDHIEGLIKYLKS